VQQLVRVVEYEHDWILHMVDNRFFQMAQKREAGKNLPDMQSEL
jgi:hypothetical protein